MSEKIEDGGEGSLEGLSEAGGNGQTEAVAQFVAFAMKKAIGAMGSLSPEARIQIDLTDEKSRGKVLEQLVHECCPKGVDVALWTRWLEGGSHSFSKKLQKVGEKSEWPGQTLMRTPPRTRRQEEKVARLREELKREEEQLDYIRAHQNASLHYFVVDQLVEIMAPAIAMGPGWCVMRAMSSFVSDESADHQTRILEGDTKIRAIAELREKRRIETEEMYETLDFFSGYEPFEKELRRAIVEVVRDFAGVRDDWQKKGGRVRAREDVLTSINPSGKAGADDVLAGLPER